MRRLIVLIGVALFPVPAVAQAPGGGDVELLGRILSGARPPAGYYELLAARPDAFEFSPENGWIVRARRVAAARAARRSAGEWDALGPEAASFQNGVLTGDLRMPVLLVLYANTDSSAHEDGAALSRSVMETRIFSPDAAPPYSVTSYYDEISDGRLNVEGTVQPWVRLSQNDTFYEGGCNGLCGSAEVGELIREAVEANDAALDYGQFDNDGPDGVPNSGDDDGYVDGLVLFHPELDGACGTSNIWAHRFFYEGWTGVPLDTDDAAANGGQIRVRDYIIQGAQGGDGGCSFNQAQAMGVVAHETGHLLGLPDLYAVGNNTSEGIGEWGLMGSGNWRVPTRPAYMTSWSRAELGWVAEVPVATDTTILLSPVETSDSALIIPVGGGEYFQLENRQRIGSDSMMNGAGLLIWHVDSVRIAQRRGSNSVNSTTPQGLALEQADGQNHLLNGNNRGDAGDPYPGASGVTRFASNTTPGSQTNAGTETHVTVDSITQVVPNGVMSFRIRFTPPSLIAASDTLLPVRVDGTPYNVFHEILDPGTDYAVSVDSAHANAEGDRRWTFSSWSDGGAREHTFTASASGDTLTAFVDSEVRLQVGTVGGGSVSSSVTLDADGIVWREVNGIVRLIALPGTGHVLDGWSGDIVRQGDTLDVPMDRPYQVTATFVPALAAGPAGGAGGGPRLADGVMGAEYSSALTATGGTGTYTWSGPSGLPEGLTMGNSGLVSGVPQELGEFTVAATVHSGSQTLEVTASLTVGAPALAADGVLNAFLGGTALSDAHQRFMDLIGNRNGRLDVGDIRAWVRAGGPGMSAAEMAQLLADLDREREGGGR